MTASLRVEANGPLDVGAVFSNLVNHEVAGLTETDPGTLTHRRIVEVAGRPHPLSVRFDFSGVTVDSPGSGRHPEGIEELVRHWFDLDSEIEMIDGHLGRGPGHARSAGGSGLATQVRSRPGIRITRYPGVFEAAIMVVLGQQISLAAARTLAGRLVSGYGEKTGSLRRFPEPERFVEEPVGRLRSNLGVTGARAGTIRAVSQIFVELPPPEGNQPESDLLERLAAVPGVGPWTISCIAMRAFNAPDEFPSTDAVLRRSLGSPSPAEAVRIARRWIPFRSYATARLWAQLAAPTGSSASGSGSGVA